MAKSDRRPVRLFERFWWILAGIVSFLVAEVQTIPVSGLHRYYEEYAQKLIPLFLSGNTEMLAGERTWPMWGYGWLLTLMPEVALLAGFQVCLAIVAYVVLFHHLQGSGSADGRSLLWLKVLVCVSVPLHVNHTLCHPGSPSSSILLLSMVLLAKANELTSKPRWIPLVGSALLFGLCLQLKSDSLLLPVAFFAAILFVRGLKPMPILAMSCWLLIVFACIQPWRVYTKTACGHALVKSTNAGHVVFVGLGHLPNNRWGITRSDSDPLMLQMVRTEFGEDRDTMGYETDRFLKEKALELISRDPVEYVKKCAFSLAVMVGTGPWEGTFLERDIRSQAVRGNPFSLLRHGPRGWLSIGSLAWAMGTSLLGFAAFPFFAWRAFKRRDLFFLFLSAAVLYQMAISALLCHIRNYTNSIYLLLLLFIVTVGSDAYERFVGRKGMTEISAVHES